MGKEWLAVPVQQTQRNHAKESLTEEDDVV